MVKSKIALIALIALALIALIALALIALIASKKELFRNSSYEDYERRFNIIFGRSDVNIYDLPFSNKIYRKFL